MHPGPHAPRPRRLPPSILSVELSCIRDTLPPQLSQLCGLQRLVVRRGLVSEGVLLTEYECLAHLTGESAWRARAEPVVGSEGALATPAPALVDWRCGWN